ncbi:MAG: hypothetical protein AAF727_02060 [Pseudomonadota bacterium]
MSHHFRHSTSCLAALLTALAAPAFADNLVVSNWDGYMAADAIDTFNSETGNTQNWFCTQPTQRLWAS